MTKGRKGPTTDDDIDCAAWHVNAYKFNERISFLASHNNKSLLL